MDQARELVNRLYLIVRQVESLKIGKVRERGERRDPVVRDEECSQGRWKTSEVREEVVVSVSGNV